MSTWTKSTAAWGLTLLVGCGTAATPDAVSTNAPQKTFASPDTVDNTAPVLPFPDLKPVPPGQAGPSLMAQGPSSTEADHPLTERQRQAAEVFQALTRAARLGDPENWMIAEEKLKGFGADAVPCLTQALSSDDSLDREMGVMFLAQLGPDAAAAATSLEHVLDDESPFIRVNAAALLTIFDDPPPSAITTLLELVANPDVNLRTTAIGALGNVPESAATTVPELLQSLQDDDPVVREAVVNTLARLGKPASSTVPQLQALLQDPEPAVKEAALFAIRVLTADATAVNGTAVTTSAETPTNE